MDFEGIGFNHFKLKRNIKRVSAFGYHFLILNKCSMKPGWILSRVFLGLGGYDSHVQELENFWISVIYGLRLDIFNQNNQITRLVLGV